MDPIKFFTKGDTEQHGNWVIIAQKPGASHPDGSSTAKHRRAFVFVRPTSAGKFKPPVLRVVVESAVF